MKGCQEAPRAQEGARSTVPLPEASETLLAGRTRERSEAKVHCDRIGHTTCLCCTQRKMHQWQHTCTHNAHACITFLSSTLLNFSLHPSTAHSYYRWGMSTRHVTRACHHITSTECATGHVIETCLQSTSPGQVTRACHLGISPVHISLFMSVLCIT